MFLNCSKYFGRHTAHHQELKNYNCSLWFYVRFWFAGCRCYGCAFAAATGKQKTYVKPEAAITVLSSWWWAMCLPKHVEQLRNIGIINSTTQLHLVSSFYEFYVTMHGSMNIKNRENFAKNSLPRLLHECVKRNTWLESNTTVTPGFFFRISLLWEENVKLGNFYLLSVFRLTLEAFPSPLYNKLKQKDAFST
jgi:hypothetical protein